MASKKIYLVYGSQTGNAESIAKDLATQLVHGDPSLLSLSLSSSLPAALSPTVAVECTSLNKIKGKRLQEDCLLLAVVCSTTGNGDAPENADGWWRAVKLRSAAKDMFAGIPYTVLGLGDTNYDKFCHVGKAVDKRLSELGAERLRVLSCADEATNLEETVELWKKDTLALVRSVMDKERERLRETQRSACEEKQTVSAAHTDTHKDTTQAHTEAVAITATEAHTTQTQTLKEESSENDLTVSLTHSALTQAAQQTHTVDVESTLRERLENIPKGLLTAEEVAALLGDSEAVEKALSETLTQQGETPSTRTQSRALRERSSADTRTVSVLSHTESESDRVLSTPSLTPSLSLSQLTLSRTESEKERDRLAAGEYTREHPFLAPLVCAKWLTEETSSCDSLHESPEQWGNNKRVVEVEIALEREGHKANFAYQPGDALGVVAPNPHYAVNALLNRLRETHGFTLTLDTLVSVSSQSSVKTAPPVAESEELCGEGEALSLRELLRYRLDLCGQPKKATLLALSGCCEDPRERALLQLMAGRDAVGKRLFNAFVAAQGLGIAEVVHLFRSCKPSLTQCVRALSELPPRYYSLACAPEIHPYRAVFALSLVRACFSAGAPAHPDRAAPPRVCRSGLCSAHLEYLARRWLYPGQTKTAFDGDNADSEALSLRVFLKPNGTFRLPGNVSLPLLLIGPGTGVAPFIGFLEQRVAQETERHRRGGETMSAGLWRGGFELEETDLPGEGNSVNAFIHSVAPGPVLLFFGCRNEDDFLYRERLQRFVADHTLSSLDVAFSRPKTVSEGAGEGEKKAEASANTKTYVTHKLLARKEEIARLIMREQALVYICGDGNAMAKDVQCALREILSGEAALSEEEATAYLQEMRLRRRLLLDIWS